MMMLNEQRGKMTLIIVTSIIICFASTSVAAFITSCNSSSRPKQQTQQSHDINLSQDVNVRELQFNLMNLIQIDDDSTKQNMKLQSLASLLEVVISTTNNIMKDAIKDNINNLHLSEKLTPYRRFVCTSPDHNDHRGNFRIFNSNEESSLHNTPSSIPLNTICSIGEDKPFNFLLDLAYRSLESLEKRGGMMYDYSEVVVWCGSYSNNDNRLEYISKVLDDMPLVQLVVGRQHHDGKEDCNKICIDLETVSSLESMGILIEETEMLERDRTIMCKLKHEDLDIIEAVLSSTHHHTNELEEETIIKLIDMAVDSIRKDPLNQRKQPQLVLVVESITATRVTGAISAWKQQQIDQHLTIQRVENLLSQALLVVTFGNVCQSFPTGPAYIHVSMLDDPWSSSLGTTAKKSSDDNDAVFFHGLSPFVYNQDEWTKQSIQSISSMKSHNAHNTLACTIQFLALIMRINGIQSFRALYDAAKYVDPLIKLDISPKHFAVNYGKKGDLVIPPRIDDELLPAMIKATEAHQWFWTDIEFEACLQNQYDKHLNHGGGTRFAPHGR